MDPEKLVNKAYRMAGPNPMAFVRDALETAPQELQCLRCDAVIVRDAAMLEGSEVLVDPGYGSRHDYEGSQENCTMAAATLCDDCYDVLLARGQLVHLRNLRAALPKRWRELFDARPSF